MNPTRFFKTASDGNIQCTLCNHYCVIKNGQTGKCGTRLNTGSSLKSLNYGYPIALNADPIEKKPLFHFMPGSLTYSLGTLGCNFFCQNCQNWDMSQAEQIEKKTESLDFVSPERIIENALGDDCPSISYTYNEPTIFTEYALDIMKLAHENNLKNVWVSNGYMSKECLTAVAPYLDAINVDLKSFDNHFYKDHCGAKLKPILDNLKFFKQEQIHLEITTLVIPTLSNDMEMLSELAEFIVNELDADTPWHLTKFNPSISWKLQKLPATGEDLIYEAYEIGKDAGLKYVYVGNIPGDQKENTYCPKCGEMAILRFGQHIERMDSHGRCAYCDKNLDIVE